MIAVIATIATIATTSFLYLAFSLFLIGMAGVVLRRDLLIVMMSVEIMLSGANVAMVAFSRLWGELDGQVVAMFGTATAAAEIAVGLAIVVAIYRGRERAEVDDAA